MNPSTAALFDEFTTAYRRGEAPDVLAYLERAGDDADAFAELVDRFLVAVPAREPTEEEVVLMQARRERDPALLVLRLRRRLTRDAVVGALVTALGLDFSTSGKVRRYYSDLEVGVLDPKPVDRKVWDALGRILDANVRMLAGLRPPPPAAPAVAYMRVRDESAKYLASWDEGPNEPAVTPELESEPVPERDEVDRLFTGSA